MSVLDHVDRGSWWTMMEALGVEEPESRELRRDLANLIYSAVHLLGERERNEAPDSRRRYQRKVAKAAGQLRELLEDAPPHALAELWDSGLRWSTATRYTLGTAPPPTQGINELVAQVREIEAFAESAGSTPHKRSEPQRRALADVAVYVFRKHRPNGNRHDAQAFTDGVYQAAVLKLDPEDHANLGNVSMERHVKVAWRAHRTKPTR